MDREIPKNEQVKRKLKIIPWILVLFLILITGQLWLRRILSTTTVRSNDILSARVIRGRMEGSFTADGILTPVSTYNVEAMTGGRIEAIFFNTGDYVKKGDTILRLSNDDLKLNLLAQEAAVAEQVNNLSNARILSNQSKLSQRLKVAEAHNALKRERRSFEQKQELQQKGFISLEEYLLAEEDFQIARTRFEYLQEEARTDSLYREQQLLQLEGAVNQLQLSLRQIRNRINELDVKAPMSGQITQMELKLGQIISSGSLLAMLEDDTEYYIKGRVDQYYLSRLSEGAEARIRHQGQDLMLHVSKIHPRLVNDKIQVDITGDIPLGMRSGQSLAIEIITDSLDDVLYLPQGQYLNDGGGHWVYVINEDGKSAARRAVKMGFRNIREVEVVEGLKEGEEVITSSYIALKEKERIQISEAR
ncbi:MAG: efflux RND transporter periplasmic adaptor subunit [Candidatus Cloacimonetes bacterium]|nr:efflux RND transporter periplasmic adaptor subunit [Candidatus Cloacimonadota bacterium]MDY0337812.1 efflux RND transporter periplasmic adaptor subunit [Candidatus Cloacimonadaceae bacterium]MDD2544614.1 efflux RND transporter periplasmic adaptor subunit [Candidatus Cloacimonadota bacterium]MDD3098066.1 efflux RND transporter periplasmic adaptor subunit [Candidatus Cloacimonadota bacterium]MDD3578577.1 efflux RND transporter periplasmic adaptor subunit [Candidatus Cloacimonadota bacterium]